LLRPFAEDILRRVQETVDVTVVDERSAIVIEQLASPQSLRVVSHVGRPLPIHCTASGKAHLGQMDIAQRRALLNSPLERFGPNAKTSVDDVLDEIATSHDRGYFVDVEEYAEGICAIAIDVPLGGSSNYAIAVSMPAPRFATNAETYIRILLDVRAAIKRTTSIRT
jgi:DNA-binding IclR family transcriptional regulator